jgi:hypothetical protein
VRVNLYTPPPRQALSKTVLGGWYGGVLTPPPHRKQFAPTPKSTCWYDKNVATKKSPHTSNPPRAMSTNTATVIRPTPRQQHHHQRDGNNHTDINVITTKAAIRPNPRQQHNHHPTNIPYAMMTAPTRKYHQRHSNGTKHSPLSNNETPRLQQKKLLTLECAVCVSTLTLAVFVVVGEG